jgi:DNA-binding CsgD family transcriptional regulator
MPAWVVEGDRATLTGRELEVLRLIGTGRTTREISSALGISMRTVENHKRRIFAKLDVQSQAHAVASAARLGLLALPGATAGPESAAAAAVTTEPATAGGDGEAARPAGVRLVLGRPGPLRERLARSLQHAPSGAIGAPAAAAGRPLTSPVAVLVDPRPKDWQAAECLGARIVLVCSGELDEDGVVEAFLRGADALVPESRVSQELATVVELVGLGCTLIHPAHARLLMEMARIQLAPNGEVLNVDGAAPSLTPREREILASIDRGESVKQTARALGISAKTVENLQGRLFRKLGVRNRAQAVAAAHARGLLPPPRILELRP